MHDQTYSELGKSLGSIIFTRIPAQDLRMHFKPTHKSFCVILLETSSNGSIRAVIDLITY